MRPTERNRTSPRRLSARPSRTRNIFCLFNFDGVAGRVLISLRSNAALFRAPDSFDVVVLSQWKRGRFAGVQMSRYRARNPRTVVDVVRTKRKRAVGRKTRTRNELCARGTLTARDAMQKAPWSDDHDIAISLNRVCVLHHCFLFLYLVNVILY